VTITGQRLRPAHTAPGFTGAEGGNHPRMRAVLGLYVVVIGAGIVAALVVALLG
jgi:hypothetical protein